MGWDQEYHVESYLELLIKLTGKHLEELLEKYLLDGPYPYVATREEVVLDENGFYGPVKGTKVTLSDGTVWIPKLTQKFNENGNHGIDTYEYHHENETPEVMYIGCICNPVRRRGACGRYVPLDNLEFLEYLSIMTEEYK